MHAILSWITAQTADVGLSDLWIRMCVQTGGVGLVAWVMYTIAKRFMDETVKQMSARIDAAEKRLDGCEEDRARLHQNFAELLLKETHPPEKRP